MSSFNKIEKVTDDIKILKQKINKLELYRNQLIQEMYKNKSTNFLKYNLFKNSNEILITKNDIECEDDQSDYEVKSENTE